MQINQKAARGRRPSIYVMRPPGESEHQSNLPTFARLRPMVVHRFSPEVGGRPPMGITPPQSAPARSRTRFLLELTGLLSPSSQKRVISNPGHGQPPRQRLADRRGEACWLDTPGYGASDLSARLTQESQSPLFCLSRCPQEKLRPPGNNSRPLRTIRLPVKLP